MIPNTVEGFEAWLAECIEEANPTQPLQEEWLAEACLQRDVLEKTSNPHFLLSLNIRLVAIGIQPAMLIDNESIVAFKVGDVEFINFTPAKPYRFADFMALVRQHYYSAEIIAA